MNDTVRSVRRLLLLAGLLTAAAALGACAQKTDIGGGPRTGTTSVIPSAAYAGRAGAAEQKAKITALQDAVSRLRAETGSSGWQARQDDVTGDAAELSGGIFQAGAGVDALQAARTFLDRYGPAFGLADAAAELRLPPSLPVDAQGSATLRSDQVHQGIPVDGASILVAVDKMSANPEISLVRGRIFSRLEVATTPKITAADASAIVSRLAGATVAPTFTLVVYTATAKPTLAWVADVRTDPAAAPGATGQALPGAISGPSRVFVDAESGALLEVRPSTLNDVGAPLVLAAEQVATAGQAAPPGGTGLGNFNFEIPPGAQPIQATGTTFLGQQITVPALQLPDGSVVLVDTTQPGASAQTKRDLITVHDGSGIPITAQKTSPGTADLPGPLLRSPGAAVSDSDAISASWAARLVLDYYRTEHGRDSFDGEGAPLPSTVHVAQAGAGECGTNGAFLTAPGQSQMIYGVPCTDESGNALVRSWVALDVVGHEVTHGVTHTNARELGGSVQTGAVDEGTSDYFGIIIMNRTLGTRYTTRGALYCTDQPGESPFCTPQNDGQRGIRNVDTGATFDDYEFVIEEPFGLAGKLVDALHENSLIYTNALWKIRTRLAAMDGGDINTSARAKKFDRVVYRATTRYFTSSTDFLAAAEAVQRAAGELNDVTPQEREIIRKQFVDSKLCRGCNSPATTARPVSISGRIKAHPQVVNGGVVYADYAGRLSSQAVFTDLATDKAAALNAEGRLTLFVAAAGDNEADLAIDVRQDRAELSLRQIRTGQTTQLTTQPALVAPAVSADSVAWVEQVSQSAQKLAWQPVGGGQAVRLDLPGPAQHIAVDGTRVAFLLDDGRLGVWDASAGGQPKLLGALPRPRQRLPFLVQPGGIAISGNRVAALALNGSIEKWAVVVFAIDSGAGSIVSDHASPFGLAMKGDHLVWADSVGQQTSKVTTATGARVTDTDIELYSFATDTFYRLFPERGQQGYPSFDGDRVAWQDSVLGGNDIFTVRLPAGL